MNEEFIVYDEFENDGEATKLRDAIEETYFDVRCYYLGEHHRLVAPEDGAPSKNELIGFAKGWITCWRAKKC